MKTLTLFSKYLLGVTAIVGFIGCQPPAAKNAKGPANEEAQLHEHEEHGPHGGHMIHLEPSESHAEWTHEDDTGRLAIHLEEIEEFGKKVDAVYVELAVKGEPKKRYDFTLAGKGVYELVSPELITAIEVGSGDKDKVTATLVVSVDGKDQTASLEHHEHQH